MEKSEAIRVLIVDDHPVVRRGITFSLMAFDDILVVGEADTGEEAMRSCDAAPPDVVVMDMMMPGMGGIAATRAIRERHPRVQVLVLSSFPEAQMVRDALKAGAVGYLLKDVAMDELAQAIRNAQAGQSTLHRAVTRALVEPSAPSPQLIEELTERQREVLALVVQGKSNQEIADLLYVTLATVRFHVSTILGKLGAANRAEAAAIAVRHQLLA